jgi:hypothetical protein
LVLDRPKSITLSGYEEPDFTPTQFDPLAQSTAGLPKGNYQTNTSSACCFAANRPMTAIRGVWKGSSCLG